VPGAAALHTTVSEELPELRVVVLDIVGRRVDLDPGVARRLRDEGAARSGHSTAARDLSLMLDRSLSRGQVLALRRAEAHTLGRLASDLGLTAVAREISSPPGSGASHPGRPHGSRPKNLDRNAGH
jgi:hypothetical protein